MLVPLLAGIALLGAFIAWALRAGDRQPIVDIRLLRLRSLGSASAVLFTAGAAMYAGMFLLPLYYQQLHGETVLHAGLLLIPQGVGSLAARFVVGRLVARLGARLVTIASFLLAAAATVPFAFAGPHTSLWLLGAVLLIRGFGIGAVLVPPMSVAYQDVPQAGIPHATMNTRIAQQVGASFGIAIVAVALQSLLAHGAAGAFQGAFWWATGITVAALIPALALPAARQQGADMQPIPATGGFSRGSQSSENTAMGSIPANDDEQSDNKQTRRRGAELESRDPRRRVGAADRRGLRAFHRRYRRRPRPDQQARALPPLEDPRRHAARHRPPPRRRRSACHSRHRHPPGRPSRAAHPRQHHPQPHGCPDEQHARQLLQPDRPHPGRAARGVPEPAQLGCRAGRQPRCRARGDRPGPAHPRIIDLPFDLFRNEMMMTLKPVPDHVLRQIVDDIFIPLVAAQPPSR